MKNIIWIALEDLMRHHAEIEGQLYAEQEILHTL